MTLAAFSTSTVRILARPDAAQVGGNLAGRTEASIQAAVGVVARQRQFHLAANESGAGRHDPAVGLQHGSMDVVELAEIRRNYAGRMNVVSNVPSAL
jgi:hypothetical protein